MLSELRIKNFAIIETLTLPLSAGLNVLSGETGAGKSIIVGALGLLLGERANADVIRTGADRATVEGVFDAEDRPEVLAQLDARGIETDDGQVVLKREVASTGRARAWINGTTVTATVLAEIGRLLVNLHGQHEAQTLLDPEAQRRILDAFGGATELAARVRTAYEDVAGIRHEIAGLTARRADAERRADYLRHVATEIEGAKLEAGEDTRLEEESHRLTHADELRTLAQGVAAALEGGADGPAVREQLAAVHRALAGLQRIDPSLSRFQELYDTAYYALDELARQCDDYASGIDLDPQRLSEVQQRRDVLFKLVKKYGPALDDVIETGRRSRRELDLVDSAAFDMRQLERRESEARAQLDLAAAALTTARASAAERLARAVDDVLPELGLTDGHLAVALDRRDAPGPAGAEDVEFRVTLNTGHDPRPLARVASGGELSRVMLALATILARLDRVPTLVFDEVDAGIGGRVGSQVGATLRRVAEHHQVFAISHLPPIAARAHHHIVVSKGAAGGVTTADVRVLDGEARVLEVARMLGDPDREVARAHARELLRADGKGDATSAATSAGYWEAAAGRLPKAPPLPRKRV
jgi:DNA repair protein RecN (Recombination protein N)